MSSRDARILEISIDSACQEAGELSYENQSRLAQLIVIWISGYLEVICRDVLLTYTEKNSDEAVTKFVDKNLRKMPSPKTDEILKLIRSFDENRANELKEFYQGRIKASIDGLITLRNEIAHGKPSPSATIVSVKKQFDDSRKLATKLKELFDVDT